MILIYNQWFRSTSEHPKLLFISHFLVFSSILAEMRVFLGWNDMFDRVRGAKIRFLFHLTLSDRFSGQRDGAENGTARNAMPRHPLLSLMDQLRKHPAQTPDAAFFEAVDVGLTDAHGIGSLLSGLLREVDRADDILLFGRESLHC